MATTKVTNRVLEVDSVGTAQLSAGAVPIKLGSEVGPFAFRNKIINGDMRIDQRNSGAVITMTNNTNHFPVDRFLSYFSNLGEAATTQRRSGDGPPSFDRYVRITTTTGNAFTGTDQSSIQHRIEGFNGVDLRWGTAAAKTITISFWVRASIAGAYMFSVNARSPYTRNYTTTYTVNAANTWEFKTITIPGDTTIGSNWIGDSDVYMNVSWGLGVGPNWYGASGSFNNWANVNLVNSSLLNNTIQPGAITGATFDITGVQLEQGSYATPFEHRPIGTELVLCQRYFQYYSGNINIQGYTNIGTAMQYTILLPVPMRNEPTVNYTLGTSSFVSIYGLTTGGSGNRLFVFANSTLNPGVFSLVFNDTRLDAEL